MSEQTPFDFGKLLPGFDFLQQLAAGGAGVPPGLRHWAAPTVNVEELEQRISELKAVQFWLEQNLMGLKATVQALEVQKMTLVTLQGMNLSVAEIAKGFTLPQADAPAQARATAQWPYSNADSAAAAPLPPAAQDRASPPEQEQAQASEEPQADQHTRPTRAAGRSRKSAAAPAVTGVTDPMQWWGALTQQFQQLAANTLRDAVQATPQMPETETKAAPASRKKTGAARKAAAKKAPPARKKAPAKKSKPAAKSPFAMGWPLPGKTSGRGL